MANKKRLIDANALKAIYERNSITRKITVVDKSVMQHLMDAPTVDAVEVKHGRWLLTADEQSNYRWNVTAECSKCHLEKGEIWAGFFPGFPKELAEDIALDNAERVKMDNYCPNCGAKMDGDGNG